jgi:2,3-diketo-5-methylthio-1-phosphopentane phosphatase
MTKPLHIFIDFDGTISVEDIGIRLLNRFAAGRYEEIDRAYERGEIGSRECLDAEWALLQNVDNETLIDAASEVGLDSGFSQLVALSHQMGASLTVVSDGFGIYVRSRIGFPDVAVVTNDRSNGRQGLYPHANENCTCGRCGTCKKAPIEAARSQGKKTIFIGDGTSDRHGARIADIVFAKERLITWCEREGVPYRPFQSLADVVEELENLGAF